MTDQYDAFMTALQARLAAIDAANLTDGSSTIRGHWQRATSLLDATSPWRRGQNEALQKFLSQSDDVRQNIEMSNLEG